MQKGKAIILNGASSSGKSTLAKALAEKLSGYLLLSLDDIGDLIEKAADLRNKRLHVAAQNFDVELEQYLFARITRLITDYSCNIILDTVFTPQGYSDLMQTLDGVCAITVGVHCPLEELERREKQRGDRPPGLAKLQYDTIHKHITYDIEVDTFNQTIEECVNAIINAQ